MPKKRVRDKLELSPTTGLNLFKECPRCFWLRYREGVHRPDTIFPSLPGGMDRVLKDYFDSFRRKNELPPEIVGKVVGKLVPDAELVAKWQNWRAGLRFEDPKLKATLRGAIDDCLLDGDLYIPIDFKTRASPPKPGSSERYYQTQLDTYAFLLSKQDLKVADYAYLIYYFPQSVDDQHQVKLGIEVVKMQTDGQRAYKIFKDAVDCYKGPMPARHTECGFCAWYSDLLEFD
ncbi:PD-(D/E)XK nuclease family protein [Candidatus Margulisiibacteriota bacterium]